MSVRLPHLAAALVLTTVLAGCATGTVTGSPRAAAVAAEITRPTTPNAPNPDSADDLTPDEFDTARWTPSQDNKDPSVDIEGIWVAESVDNGDSFTYPAYQAALHIDPSQRVAYDRLPPVGGPHDPVWAACDGTVYDVPVRDESMVHALEHGAVWIAYQPELVPAADVELLAQLVELGPYLMLSPYPTLEAPISLQSWGHQLQVDSIDDERISQYLISLLRNQYVYPEVGATCDQPNFDVEDPPAFDGSPRDDTAVPLDGGP